MHIKTRYLSLIFKLSIILIGSYGLYKSCFFNSVSLEEHFAYYTNLSNLICIIYFIFYIIKCYLLKEESYNSCIKGSVTLTIAITGIVYNFLLRPFMHDVEGVMDLHSLSNYIVHIIMPLIVILDWILFDEKGKFKKYYIFIWLILPFLYFIFICIRASLGKTFTYASSRYPYFFLDIDAYGVLQVLLNVSLAIIAVLTLGYIFFKVDNLLMIKKERRLKLCQN